MQVMSRSPSFSATWMGTVGRARLLAALGLAALLGGIAAIAVGSGGADGRRTTAAAPASTQAAAAAKPATKPAAAVSIVVHGITGYDPQGDHTEDDSAAPFATDGNPTTAWRSEHYYSTFTKSGVGLVLDAGRPVSASRLVLTTDTPGYNAQIEVGAAASGPFTPVSASQTTTARTAYALTPRSARYLLVWITSMPAGGVAAVNEVTVVARS